MVSKIMIILEALATSAIESKIGDLCNKRKLDLFISEIKEMLENYILKNDNTILTDSLFSNYISNIEIFEKCINFVFEPQYKKGVKIEFINKIVEDFQKYVEDKGKIIKPNQRSLLFGFINRIVDKCEKFAQEELGEESKHLLYPIMQGILTLNQKLEGSIPLSNSKEKKIDNTVEKIKYDFPLNYISRKCMPYDINSEKYSYLYLNRGKILSLYDICKINKKVVLLSNAGCGKTVELEQLAAEVSQADDIRYPLLIHLNIYISQTIEQLIPEAYKNNDPDILFFIFDGFDEIESQNKNNFIRNLKIYCQEHTNTFFLFSSRTNFYSKSITLEDFEECMLCPLTDEDIEQYINKLDISYELFYREVKDNKLLDLLKIPFYLKCMSELYIKNKKMPSRVELMESLIKSKFNFDIKKFNGTKELENKIYRLTQILMKLGSSIQCLGRNYLKNEEYQELLEKNEDIDLIQYSGIWKKNSERSWGFEHKNFGEYLAACYLATKDLEFVKEIVTYKANRNKIKENWYHTLAFLVTIYEDKNIINWILDIDPEALVSSETDKLSLETRISIFCKNFENLKEKCIWSSRGKVSQEDMAIFAQSTECLEYLLDEIKEPAHSVSLSNALHFIMEFQTLFGKGKDVKRILTGVCLEEKNRDNEKGYALIALAKLGLQDECITQELMRKFWNSENSWIRYGMYAYLNTSKYINQNIDFFIEGLQYSNREHDEDGDLRASGESTELLNGLFKISTEEACVKVLILFDEDNYDFFMYDKEKLIEFIYDVLTGLYEDTNEKMWWTIFELFVKGVYYCDFEKYMISFFSKTKTREKLLEKVCERKICAFDKVIVIERIFENDLKDKLIKMYQENLIESEVMIGLLKRMNPEKEYYVELHRIVEDRENIKIERQPRIDYEKLQKEGENKYFCSLFIKNNYIEMIEELCCLSKNKQLKVKQLKDLHYSDLEKRIDLRNLKWDLYHAFENKEDILVTDCILKLNWEVFSITKIYEHLKNKKLVLKISDEQKEYIHSFYKKYIKEVDIRTMIKYKDDSSFSSDYIGMYSIWFMLYFEFECSEKNAIDLLMYPAYFFNEKNDEKKLEYLKKYLPHEILVYEMTRNLLQENLMGVVYQEHINFAINNKIEEISEVVMCVVKDTNRSESVRRTSIDYIILMYKESVYDVLLPYIKGDLLFYLVEKIYEDKNLILIGRLKSYIKENPEDEMRAIQYLINMQAIEGIERYIEIVSVSKHAPKENTPGEHVTAAIGNISNPDMLSYLNQLAYICLEEEFIDCRFNSLSSSVKNAFIKIACIDEGYYHKVHVIFNDLIKNINGFSWGKTTVNFWMEELELQTLRKSDKNMSVRKVRNIFGF